MITNIFIIENYNVVENELVFITFKASNTKNNMNRNKKVKSN